MKYLFFIYFILGVLCSPIYANQDTIDVSRLKIYAHKKKIIDEDIDLQGGVLNLPTNVTLVFKNGQIKNGTIVGNKTKIISKERSFKNVKIVGNWNVPIINSTWFEDIENENALKNVIALTNPLQQNKVIISKGNYLLNIDREGHSGLTITSNTELVIDGIITLKPNSLKSCNMIGVVGENISISGRGIIVGDKYSHLGTQGEWGMGIRIKNSKNVLIENIVIKECWGDCIYIGQSSKNIRINNCNLIDGRRQGISITSANEVYIEQCKISKVRGTSPQYAIDIEPNRGDTVNNIMIKQVEAFDCFGGFLIYGLAKNAHVGKVRIEDCKVEKCVTTYPMRYQKCNALTVNNCYVDAGKHIAILFHEIGIINAKRNGIKTSNKTPIKFIECSKKHISQTHIIE